MWTDDDCSMENSTPASPAKSWGLGVLPIPIKLLDAVLNSDDDESESDSDDDESIRARGPPTQQDCSAHEDEEIGLDRWETASRVWLSSGTIFLLMLLFHVWQIRTDIRSLTASTNDQIQFACSVIDDKAFTVRQALQHAVQDLNPVSLTFLKDAIANVRGVILFSVQVIGGRVREFLMSQCKDKICLVYGIFVGLEEFLRPPGNELPKKTLEKKKEKKKKKIWVRKRKTNTTPLAEEAVKPETGGGKIETSGSFFDNFGPIIKTLVDSSFIKDVRNALDRFINFVLRFIRNPESFFVDTVRDMLDNSFDFVLEMAELPGGLDISSSLCDSIKKIDFDDINDKLRYYLMWLIILLLTVLIVFNYIQFVRAAESFNPECAARPDPPPVPTTRPNPVTVTVIRIIPFSPVRRALGWLICYLSYPQFWLYLILGCLGVVHLLFSRHLEAQIVAIKTTTINPILKDIAKQSKQAVFSMLATAESDYKQIMDKLLGPITGFFTRLCAQFDYYFGGIIDLFRKAVDLFDSMASRMQGMFLIGPLASVILGVLDCFFLRKVKSWIRIITLITERFFTKPPAETIASSFGGLTHLLKRAVIAVLKSLRVTKHARKLFSFSFSIFLRLMSKKSSFMYIYLLLCLLLLLQALVMVCVRFMAIG